MKANEAPKKIYITNYNIEALPKHEQLSGCWHEVSLQDTDIEYTRTDAFIKKACEYLSYHLDTSKIDVDYKFEFMEEFRKHMKGE